MKLSDRDRARLAGVHVDLVRVVERAAKLTKQPFFVIEGLRTLARQKELFARGRTVLSETINGKRVRVPKVTWTMNSKHRAQKDGFGHAVDIAPLPLDWNDPAKFSEIARAMFQAAGELKIPIRWGADWDRDGKARERGESDSPHFELWR